MFISYIYIYTVNIFTFANMTVNIHLACNIYRIKSKYIHKCLMKWEKKYNCDAQLLLNFIKIVFLIKLLVYL